MGVPPSPMYDMRVERSEREVKEEVQRRRMHAMHAVTRVRPAPAHRPRPARSG